MIDVSEYDFLDFGCSQGGSIKMGQERFGGRKGLGIDLSPKKVAQARAAGYHAIVGDLTTLDLNFPNLRFVLMIHFLEHLPGFREAKACIENACQLANEFVYIQQPYFDADNYLFNKRLKLYWSDWTGHSFRMSTLDVFKILQPLQEKNIIRRFWIYGDRRICNSSHTSIHSIYSPTDQHQYDPGIHPDKNRIDIDYPCFSQLMILIQINNIDTADVIERIPYQEVLFDSKSSDQHSFKY